MGIMFGRTPPRERVKITDPFILYGLSKMSYSYSNYSGGEQIYKDVINRKLDEASKRLQSR